MHDFSQEISQLRTYLPFANFAACAFVMDDRTVEQSFRDAHMVALCHQGTLIGYDAHPVVAMWRGYSAALLVYKDVMLREYARRGYNPRMHPSFRQQNWDDLPLELPSYTPPPWLGHFPFHERNRAVLLVKNNAHYSTLGWSEEPHPDMLWPV